MRSYNNFAQYRKCSKFFSKSLHPNLQYSISIMAIPLTICDCMLLHGASQSGRIYIHGSSIWQSVQLQYILENIFCTEHMDIFYKGFRRFDVSEIVPQIYTDRQEQHDELYSCQLDIILIQYKIVYTVTKVISSERQCQKSPVIYH